jgi:hypothetical protein
VFLLIKESWCLRGYDKVLLSVLVDWAEQNSEANPRQSINATQTDIVLQLQVSRTTFHDFRTRSSNKRHSSVQDHKLCTHKSFDVSPLEVSSYQIVLPTTPNTHHIATAHISEKQQGSVNLPSELYHSSVEYRGGFRSLGTTLTRVDFHR